MGDFNRKPTLRRIAVVTIVLLAGLVAAAIAYRQSIAEALLMRQLHNLGLDRAEFVVRRFDAGLLEVEDLSIGRGDGLQIAQIEAYFSARGLFASRLDALRISGVRLRGTLDEAGLSLGPLDRLFEPNSASANPGGSAALPVSSIEIEDALLELATAEGPLRVGVELQATESAPGQFEVDAELRVDHAFANLDAHLRSEFSFRISKEDVIEADLEVAPVGVDFEMELATPNRELVIEISGSHEFAEARGQAGLDLHAIDFDPAQLQPSTLFPILSDHLTEVSGSIEMKGSVDWNADGMRGTIEVAASDLSATAALATLEHLNAIIELNETGATLSDQTLSVGRLDFGLELTDGLIRFRVEPGGIVAIESASWKFAGGELTTAGEIDPRSENWETSLLAKGVDLTKLLELVNLDGLSGSGTLEGEFPIALVGGEIEIRNAVLRSSGEAGVIRYRPDPGTADIAAADDQFATTLAVLENFHYERLEIEINGPALGAVAVQIHLAGVNPDYQEGHPVDFKLSVAARLADLLRDEMRIYRIPAEIEERLRAFAKRAL